MTFLKHDLWHDKCWEKTLGGWEISNLAGKRSRTQKKLIDGAILLRMDNSDVVDMTDN